MKKEVSARVTVILLLAALAFCLYGIWRGEAVTVLTKAVSICMECIGLG